MLILWHINYSILDGMKNEWAALMAECCSSFSDTPTFPNKPKRQSGVPNPCKGWELQTTKEKVTVANWYDLPSLQTASTPDS